MILNFEELHSRFIECFHLEFQHSIHTPLLKDLQSFLRLKNEIPPTHLSFYVHSLYNFVVQEVNSTCYWHVKAQAAYLLKKILKKKPNLDHLLDFTPLNKFLQAGLFRAQRNPTSPSNRKQIQCIFEYLSKCRMYFEPSTVECTIEKACFYPNDFRYLCRAQGMLLAFFPFHSLEMAERYFDFFLEQFTAMSNFPKFTGNWIHAFAKLSSKHPKAAFWERSDFKSRLFERIPSLFTNQSDTVEFDESCRFFLKHCYLKKSVFQSLAKLIVKLFDLQLEQKILSLFSLFDNAFHPTNSDESTKMFCTFIFHLTSYFASNAEESRREISPVLKGTLVDYAFGFAFAKDHHVIQKAHSALKELAIIDASFVFSIVLPVCFEEIQAHSGESHRFYSCLGLLVSCLRSWINHKAHPEGYAQISAFLPMICSLLDANSPKRLFAALDFLLTLFNFVPLVDAEFACSFVVQIVRVVENIAPLSKSTAFTSDNLLLVMCFTVTHQIMHQCSSLQLYNEVLSTLNACFADHFHHPKRDAVAVLFGIFKGCFADAFLASFFPRLLLQAQEYLEEEEEQAFCWYLKLLCSSVKECGSGILGWRRELLAFFQLAFQKIEKFERKTQSAVAKFLKWILFACARKYPMEMRCFSGECKEQIMQKFMSTDSLETREFSPEEVQWHIPTEKEIGFSKDLLQLLTPKSHSFASIVLVKGALKGIAAAHTENEFFAEKKLLGTFLFEGTNETLLNAMNEELQIQVTKCWKAFFLAKTNFPSRLEKMHAGQKYLKKFLITRKKSKNISRTLFIKKAYLQYLEEREISCLSNSSLSNVEVFDNFIRYFCLGESDSVRNASFVVMAGMLKYYPIFLPFLLDFLCKEATSPTSKSSNEDKVKGICGILIQRTIVHAACCDVSIFESFSQIVLSLTPCVRSIEVFDSVFKKIESHFAFPPSQLSSETLNFVQNQFRDLKLHLNVRINALILLKAFTSIENVVPHQLFLEGIVHDNAKIRSKSKAAFNCLSYRAKAANRKFYLSKETLKPESGFIHEPFVGWNGIYPKQITVHSKEQSPIFPHALPAEFINKFISIAMHDADERNDQFFKSCFKSFSSCEGFVEAFNQILSDSFRNNLQKHHIQLAADIFYASSFSFDLQLTRQLLLQIIQFKSNIEFFQPFKSALSCIFYRKDPSKFTFLLETITTQTCTFNSFVEMTKNISLQTAILERTHWKLIDTFVPLVSKTISQCTCFSGDLANQIFLLYAYADKGNGQVQRLIEAFLQPSPADLPRTKTQLNWLYIVICDSFSKFFMESPMFHTSLLLLFTLEDKPDTEYTQLLCLCKNKLGECPVPLATINFLLQEVCLNPKVQLPWKVLCDNLKCIAKLFINNCLAFTSPLPVFEAVKQICLSHASPEVRITCSTFITAIAKFINNPNFCLQECHAAFNAFDQPQSTIDQKHGLLLVVIGCLNTSPYRIDAEWMPTIVEQFAKCASKARGILATLCRSFLAEFKRSHLDAWHLEREKFTPDQLLLLNELLVSPNYYA